MEEVNVAIELGEEAYQVKAKAREHTWQIDEPKEIGGGNTGPTPSEMVLSGLGSCTAITCKMYAARKNWPLEGVQVDLKITEKEVLHEGQLTRIDRTIVFFGDLSEEQKDRLLHIAKLCPVAKMLTGTIEINSSWINQK